MASSNYIYLFLLKVFFHNCSVGKSSQFFLNKWEKAGKLSIYTQNKAKYNVAFASKDLFMWLPLFVCSPVALWKHDKDDCC